MELGEYVRGLPRGERQKFREKLAMAHGCSVSLVRKWENWPPPLEWDEAKVQRMSRRHPADLSSIRITETETQGMVTRMDMRPECWSDE